MRKCIPAIAAMIAATAATAGQTTASLPISTTVVAACTVSAAPLQFGTYTPAKGALRARTRVRVACANGTRFSVALGAGRTAGTSFAQRLLASGVYTLRYNLYTNRAATRIWGDGTAGTRTVGGRGRGPARPVSMTVYGQLPDDAINRAAAAGSYSDVIAVTVKY